MRVDPADFNDITREILAGANTPCLQYELTARKLRFAAQRAVPIVYKGMAMGAGYRIDLVVEDVVVVELKSASVLLPVHQAQILTYLNLTACPVGLLINFNVPRLMDGVKRLINPRATVTRRTETKEGTN